jgi:hypothetical protein
MAYYVVVHTVTEHVATTSPDSVGFTLLLHQVQPSAAAAAAAASAYASCLMRHHSLQVLNECLQTTLTYLQQLLSDSLLASSVGRGHILFAQAS